MALTSVSLATGATLNGRALARNAGVTLDTNTITKAACATAPTTPATPAVPAKPSVTNSSATTGARRPVTVVLHGTNASGTPLTYAIVRRPSHGTLGPINQRTGSVRYTPRSGYTGRDSFTYKATSSNGTSNTATVTITVTRAGGTKKKATKPASPTKPAAAQNRAGFTG